MLYSKVYESPIGKLLLVSDDTCLHGVWLEGQKFYCPVQEEIISDDSIGILKHTADWLDRYFNGTRPSVSELKINLQGTNFRQEVWRILCEIPYGQTMTYGEIAKQIAKNHGKEKMSAQAVGGAVGHNPISIIVPCHRVVGTNGSLTGYAGGIKKKLWLLEHEQV